MSEYEYKRRIMGRVEEDIDILDWLYKMDRETLGEDICGNGHHFHKGKYDFCPICGCKFKAESEVGQMTNEEAIAILQKIKPTPRRADGKSTTHILEMIALDIAIKALEQEPILDKIRAEIKDWQTDIHDNEYDAESYDFVFERIYEIIDENKAESEE